MEAVGFKNFRLYRDFPAVRLSPITILVGGNNSGKSTLVKGALLVYNFLQTKCSDVRPGCAPELSFDVTIPFDIHIGTLGRAKTKSAPAGEGMEFSLSLCGMTYTVCTEGGDKDYDKTSTRVVRIEVADTVNGMKFIFDFGKCTARAIFPARESCIAGDKHIKLMEDKLIKLTEERNNLVHSPVTDLSSIVALNDYISHLQNNLCSLKAKNTVTSEVSIPLYVRSVSGYYIGVLLREINFYPRKSDTDFKKDKRTAAYKEEVFTKNMIISNGDKIGDSLSRVTSGINRKNIEYIFAHSASQKLFYDSKDRNDYIAETIHQFVKARISHEDEVYSFVRKWMGKDKFAIGTDFHIIPHGGEAYELEIKNFNGDVVPLADKGMGSIQVMVMLLRIATIAKKCGGLDQTDAMVKKSGGNIASYKVASCGDVIRPTVLIEEPEQNLHPGLQSRLAELWKYVNDRYGIRFIIETHSEYMVRKTQSIVRSLECRDDSELAERNPFKVYYFPEDKAPYEMGYRTDGKFIEDFGPGFYDVSSDLVFDIM